MSSRARLSSPDSTRLVILGLLCRHGPLHGYQLRWYIEGQNIDRFANIQFGSIYGSLKRMADEAYVESAGREQPGSRPPRTSYAITELGKKELRRLMTAALIDAGQAERPIDVALHFSALLSPGEVAELLRHRLEALDRYDAMLVTLARHKAQGHSPGVIEIIEDMSDHFRRVNRAEKQWTTRVLARVEAGAYRIGPATLADGAEPT